MSTHSLFIIALLLFAQAHPALAKSGNCIKYEPESITLTGKLRRETFPGRPNYESVANGDEAETGFYLSLESPICTVGDSGADRVAFESVLEIQLVLSEKQYAMLRSRLGEKIGLCGQLFSAHTGHHHADVLMRVSN